MKKTLAVLLVLATVLGMCAFAAADEKAPEEYTGNLFIYSPHEPEPIAACIAAFQAKYPNINVEYLIQSTGICCQRIVAEAENPICDVLWGGGADSLAGVVDYFEPYVCANDDVIGDKYKDANDLWIGESPLPMVIMYNKNMVAEEDIPKTWEDLTNEKFKGSIAYANPVKCGSGYTQLCTMLFSQPTIEEGWELVKKFVANLDGELLDSSSYCHRMVASGEYAIGVTLEKAAVLYSDNPDVGYVYPAKNSAVPDAIALVKNCPNPENAKLFIDFVTGYDCQAEQNIDWKRRPVRSDLTPVGLCALSELDIGEYDFAYAANNREAILEAWNDLFLG